MNTGWTKEYNNNNNNNNNNNSSWMLHHQNLIPMNEPETIQKTKPTFLVKVACAAIAGVTGTLCIYPLDMVKTRLQNQKINNSGGLDCLRQILRNEGAKGLYKGLTSNLIGIIPEKAIKLIVNDYCREYFAKLNHDREIASALSSNERVTALKNCGSNPDHLPWYLGMVAGATAGFCQFIVTNPMEIVKINTQMASQVALATKSKEKTSLDIVKELGFRGLYKGSSATLLRDIPFSLIFFPASAFFKNIWSDLDIKKGGSGIVPFSGIFLSGILSGIIAAFIVTPMDVVKTRLQTKGNGENYRGIFHCAQSILQIEGASAFFKGSMQRCMIVAPLFGITLFVYEAQQKYFSKIKQ